MIERMKDLIEKYEETLKNITERIDKLQSDLKSFKGEEEKAGILYRISMLETEYSELCYLIHDMRTR